MRRYPSYPPSATWTLLPVELDSAIQHENVLCVLLGVDGDRPPLLRHSLRDNRVDTLHMVYGNLRLDDSAKTRLLQAAGDRLLL